VAAEKQGFFEDDEDMNEVERRIAE